MERSLPVGGHSFYRLRNGSHVVMAVSETVTEGLKQRHRRDERWLVFIHTPGKATHQRKQLQTAH
jgi:hypothetical protein